MTTVDNQFLPVRIIPDLDSQFLLVKQNICDVLLPDDSRFQLQGETLAFSRFRTILN
jgi:hypothetical protein